MRSIASVMLGFMALAAVTSGLRAGAEAGSCTGDACSLRCRGTWHDERAKATDYELRHEPACARRYDPWLAPVPECRPHPACGRMYVKKRLYTSEREGRLERQPRYEVEVTPAEPCGCAACRGGGRWDPFGFLRCFFPAP